MRNPTAAERHKPEPARKPIAVQPRALARQIGRNRRHFDGGDRAAADLRVFYLRRVPSSW